MLKYYYYGTMFVLAEQVFRLSINWSSDWERVMDAHATAQHYYSKWKEHEID